MGQVSVTIAGRAYRMACDDGEEPHLTQLASDVDARIADMRQGFGEIGDQRLIVMAAVSIADDRAEALRRIEKLEADVARLKETSAGSEIAVESWALRVAQALDEATSRIERAAGKGGAA